jgi:hypothetical protein
MHACLQLAAHTPVGSNYISFIFRTSSWHFYVVAVRTAVCPGSAMPCVLQKERIGKVYVCYFLLSPENTHAG